MTSKDALSKRNRKRRLAIGLAAAYGPMFLLAFAFGDLRRIGNTVGVSEAFIAEHFRAIFFVALFGALAVSHLLLALLKRQWPPSARDQDIHTQVTDRE